MTNLSRRLVLTSGLFVPVAPSICRADSLMRLTGVNMDPIVIARQHSPPNRFKWFWSAFNAPWAGAGVAQQFVAATADPVDCNGNLRIYQLMRASEIDGWKPPQYNL